MEFGYQFVLTFTDHTTIIDEANGGVLTACLLNSDQHKTAAVTSLIFILYPYLDPIAQTAYASAEWSHYYLPDSHPPRPR